MSLILLATCLLAAPNVELTPLDGAAVRGKLETISSDEVTLQVGDEKQSFPAKGIEELRFTATPVNDFSPLRVFLADGSELHPSQVTLTAGKIKCEFGLAGFLEMSVKQVRAILFKRQNADLHRQWREIEKGNRSGDLVVVRRKATKPVEDAGKPAATAAIEESLDFVDGAVTAIGTSSVEFDLGDDESSLKREKLDGVIFGRRGATEVSPAKFVLVDANGSRWNAVSFLSKGDDLELRLASGDIWRLPERDISSIDYSPGNVFYLDTVTADLTEASFDLVPASLKASTERLFQPRRISPDMGERVRLGQQSYQRGLLLQGETRLVYQVPAGYQRFTAIVGLPITASKQVNARIVIMVDNQPPWEQSLSVNERGPFPVELSIAGAKKLTIRLEDAQGLSLSDQVLLCKARFLR